MPESQAAAALGFTRTPSEDDPRRDSKLLRAISRVAPGTAYSYAIEAVDAAGHATRSDCTSVTTPTSATLTFTPVADSYVAADNPSTNYGGATKLRADASPDRPVDEGG